MAVPVNIDDLINHRTVESTRIEYKAGFNPEAIVHTICAFANDIDNMGGGYIIIGVEEQNGEPVFPVCGVPKNSVDGILKKMREYCRFIEPLYEPVVQPMVYEGAHVIVIWAPGGYGRPYKASKSMSENQSLKYYYIRKFANTVIASPEEEKELFYASTSIPFDDRPNLAAEVGDLDISLMRSHLKEIGSALYPLSLQMDTLELAKDMQLVNGPPEALRPLNVGLLMFCAQPEKYFRYAQIEVVDIPDPTGSNMTERIFTGPIQVQLRDALQYISNYVIKSVISKDDTHAESDFVYNYPFRAVEEILSNAVYHRSYQIHEPITVRITPEAMEITSFPGFDQSITDEKIQQGDLRARIYRNRRIGGFLKELHLIEGRNTGFPNAYNALQKNGSEPLRLEMDPERNYLSVTIPIHPDFLEKRSEKRRKKDQDYADTILDILYDAPLTLTGLSNTMGYKGITEKLRRTVARLEKTGDVKKEIRGNETVIVRQDGKDPDKQI